MFSFFKQLFGLHQSAKPLSGLTFSRGTNLEITTALETYVNHTLVSLGATPEHSSEADLLVSLSRHTWGYDPCVCDRFGNRLWTYGKGGKKAIRRELGKLAVDLESSGYGKTKLRLPF